MEITLPQDFDMYINYVSIYSLCTACKDQDWVQLSSVEQVEFFYKISIIKDKNDSFEGLKLNIS